MKKINKIVFSFLAIVTMLSINACIDDDDKFEFISQAPLEDIVIKNSFLDQYVLTNETISNLAERFVWDAPDFGTGTIPDFELQGSASMSFDAFTVLGSTTKNEIGITVKQLFTLAAEAGLDNDPDNNEIVNNEPIPNNIGDLYFRIKGSVGSQAVNEILSEVLTLTVFLPEPVGEEVELPKLYLVGGFLSASGYGNDWTPADAPPISASDVGKTDFEGFVFIKDDGSHYKFLPTNESFDGDYGDTGDSDGSYSETIEQDNEVNCGTPGGTGGYFWVKADTNALTYSLTLTNWGIIGNSTPTGWDSDTDMIYDPVSKTWSLTLDLITQEAPDNGIKFRANDGWDINIGDTDADGTMEFGGQNIGVPEDGNYTVILDLSNPRAYTYSLTKN